MTETDIIVGLNNIAAKYGYGKGTEPFTNDEWNTIFCAKLIIKDYAKLTAENDNLMVELEVAQRDIDNLTRAIEEANDEIKALEAENAGLQETLSKMETVEKELRARLETAVELPCKVGDTVYFIPASISKTSEFFIMEWKIESIIIMEKSYTLNCVDSKKRFCYMFDRLFGIQWFTDRTKAEARLKELQGGER